MRSGPSGLLNSSLAPIGGPTCWLLRVHANPSHAGYRPHRSPWSRGDRLSWCAIYSFYTLAMGQVICSGFGGHAMRYWPQGVHDQARDRRTTSHHLGDACHCALTPVCSWCPSWPKQGGWRRLGVSLRSGIERTGGVGLGESLEMEAGVTRVFKHRVSV